MEMRSCAGRSRRFQPRARERRRARWARHSMENGSWPASLRSAAAFEFAKNAVAHLCCGGVGKGDGDDLAGVIDLTQQAKKAAGEQIGLA